MGMRGKTCVITGGTSGIGQAAAYSLAQMGARVVLVARSERRALATMMKLRTINPDAAHAVHYADLSSIADTKRAAGEISAAEPKIDVLINNAGALFSYRRTTRDGLERTFALNHVAYVVLTHGLSERLLSSAPARVVNTASGMHQAVQLDFDNLQGNRGYDGVSVYRRSKLCNVLFTRELARRLAGTGVTANSLHPGLVASRFGNRSGGFVTPIFWLIKHVAGLSVEKGARTTVYLASSDEVAGISGRYFERCREVSPSREAEDDEAAQRLWVETSRLAAIDWALVPGIS
jgi:NAD(P)-dependent dehydrogenase (short-subunit alcohol dehydrogenase family)